MKNIHEQADQIVADAMPEHIPTNDYEQQRALHFIEQAKELHKDEGNWELGDIQIVLMTNPMPGMYSIQFWFVILIDKAQMKVTGAIFSETRD